jgi:hypothetical protein
VRRRAWKSGILWLVWAGLGWGQSSIHLPTQGRSADFSGFPQTKPARVVTVLPAGCAAGEAVAVAAGTGAGLYVCNSAGQWVAAAPHGHSLSELSGVTGKNGAGSLLQAFGGGAVQAGDCAEFDENGNLVSARTPCGGRVNFSLSFANQSAVLLNHGLGTRNVLVGCVDENEQQVIANRIVVLNENEAQVEFVLPQSGRCVVNASGGAGGGGSGAVSSVFGRTGAVAAQAGDYSFSQIGGQLALSQIAPSALQGNGSKIQLFSGTAAANECAKFDGNGNLVSAGVPCGTGSVSSVFGRAGAVTAQAGDYSFSQIGGQLALSQIAPSALQGNGSKIQLFSGTAAANECAKFDGNGNLVSAGAACGTGNGDVIGPPGSGDGEVALFQGTTGKLLKRATGTGVARLANGVLQVVSGPAGDCVRADGSTGPCGGTVYFGAGLEGGGTASDPVRLASGGSVASQTFYSASLTFGTVASQSCAELSIAAPGVAPGETVAAGMPPTLPAGIAAMMYGGADVVVVRLCNLTGANVDIPADTSFSARVVRGF